MAAANQEEFIIEVDRLKETPCNPPPPTDIGEYSYEHRDGFKDDDRRKRIYIPPNDFGSVNFDVYRGNEDFVHEVKDRKKYFSNILRWLQRHHREVQDEGKEGEKLSRLPVDVVCRRGLLTNLLIAPYDDRNGFKVMASKFRKTLYLLTEDSKEEQKVTHGVDPESELHKQLYGGFKFLSYVTADSEDGVPNPDQPVDSLSGYYRVFTRTVGKHNLLYSGEVDAFDLSAPEGDQYVEFKTQMDRPQRFPQVSTFPFIKWWAQASSVGINKIVVGLHGNPKGTIKRLRLYPVADIPKMNYRYPWNTGVCYSFLDKFLSYIQEHVTSEDPNDVYVFEKPADSKTITFSHADPDSSDIFLPEWYVDWDGWKV